MTIFEATIITSATVSVLSLHQTSSPSPQWASGNFLEQIANVVILPLKMFQVPPNNFRVKFRVKPWAGLKWALQAVGACPSPASLDPTRYLHLTFPRHSVLVFTEPGTLFPLSYLCLANSC